MNRNFVLLIFIVLFLTAGVTTGCGGWVGILDTNPYDDKPVDDQEYHEEYVEQIRQELLGSSEGEVLRRLGKPTWVNQLGNYQMVSKFRENQYVFDGVKKCRMSECGPIFADESWAYGWERKIKQYYSHHGFGVFLKNGVVVSVE